MSRTANGSLAANMFCPLRTGQVPLGKEPYLLPAGACLAAHFQCDYSKSCLRAHSFLCSCWQHTVLRWFRLSVFILWFLSILQQSSCSSAINIESNPKIDGCTAFVRNVASFHKSGVEVDTRNVSSVKPMNVQ